MCHIRDNWYISKSFNCCTSTVNTTFHYSRNVFIKCSTKKQGICWRYSKKNSSRKLILIKVYVYWRETADVCSVRETIAALPCTVFTHHCMWGCRGQGCSLYTECQDCTRDFKGLLIMRKSKNRLKIFVQLLGLPQPLPERECWSAPSSLETSPSLTWQLP